MTEQPRPFKDNELYFVKSKTGSVDVARYLSKYNLFYAVDDSIGYLSTIWLSEIGST